MWRASLRARLILMVLLAIVPALMLALSMGLRQRALLVDHAAEIAERLADDASDDQRRLVASTRRLLETLATHPVVMGDDRVACNALLTKLLIENDWYTNLAVLLPNGDMVCSGTPMNGSVNVGDRLYFQRAVKSRQFALADYVIGRVSGKATLLTGLPVLSPSGEVRAVLHAGIDLTWINHSATAMNLPEGSQITVIRRDGIVLVRHPDPQEWVGKAFPSEGTLAASVRAGEPSGSGRLVDQSGTERLYAFTTLGDRDAQGADVVISVSTPTSIALAKADAELQRNLLALGIVSLLALVAAWFGGEAFLLRRVRGLVAVSEQLAGGDLGARARADGDSGELGRLARAFDRMAESLQYRLLEREAATRALTESEARYRSVVEHVKEVIFQTDADGRWTFLNPAWTEVTGFAVGESLGTPFLEYVHPDDRAHNLERFAPLIRREKAECRHEVRYLHADGGYRWVEVYARLMLDGERVVGTSGTLMDVTDRRQASEALLRQDCLLRGVAEATNHLLISSSFEEAVDAALATLGTAADVDRVAIIEVHREPVTGRELVTQRFGWSSGRMPAVLAGGKLRGVPPDPELDRWYRELRAGRPIRGLVRELPPEEAARLEPDGTLAVLIVPIVVQGELWGLLGFDDCVQERSWSDTEVSILVALAGSIGGAMARQQGEEALRIARQVAERESERLLALHRASTALGSGTADPSEVVEDILRSAADLLDGDAASLYSWDDEAGLLRSGRNWGIPHEDHTPDRVSGQGIAGQAFSRNAPVIVNDYQTWAHATASGKAGGLRSGIGVPLRHGGRSVGVLMVRSYRVAGRPFGDDDARVAELFADQAAAVLENARLFSSMERRLERLRALARLAQIISSSLDTAEVMHEAAQAAARLTGAALASLWVVDEETRKVRVTAFSEHPGAADFPRVTTAIGEGAVGWVAQTREDLDVPDVGADDRLRSTDWWQRHGLTSFYGFPVVHDDRLLAVLALIGSRPFAFGPEDRDLLGIFVAQIATAFRNATLFETIADANLALEESVQRANELAQVARAADRAKSEFLSRMSHELRTPMNAILGFAQIVELQDRDGKHGESVGHILKAGHHLLGLINEVLDISRIESGRLHLSLEPVDVVSVSNEVADLVRPLTEGPRIDLAIDHPAVTPSWVMADRQRLKQILLNLMTNAVKYNRPGGSVVVTICGSGLVGGGRVRIAVRDSGVGIEPSKLSRLFEPFDRLDADVQGIEGTGLGLTIARSLADAMGGTLTVESTLGAGSTFWLTLPAAEAPGSVLGDLASPATLPSAVATPPRHVVLYVEDNPPNRLLIERVFEWRPDVELVTATDGRTGLALARSRLPSLVLLDLHLPDLGGRDVLEALSCDPRTAGIPVVILSADASPGQIQRLLNAGARSYLTKPIVVRELLETIDSLLDQAA